MNLNNFENVTHIAQGETIFLGGIFCLEYPSSDAARKDMFISQTTDFHFANYRFSFRKLQIFISQTTDSHFANYRFSFRKLQIPISQTTDSHFANYRFPFRFVPFRFANYSKPILKQCVVSFHNNYVCAVIERNVIRSCSSTRIFKELVSFSKITTLHTFQSSSEQSCTLKRFSALKVVNDTY